MAVINAPFESRYGFKGPGFTVDDQGNITATSIITSISDGNSLANFTVTDTGEQFIFTGIVGNNPTITLARSSVYRFALTVPNLKFKIYQSDQETLYSTGLTHSDTSIGVDAQGKEDGTLTFSVSAAAPSLLYYGNNTGSIFGTINIVDPAGSFSTVDVNSITASTSSTTGAMTIAGGVGIEGDLFIGGSLNIDGIGLSAISSPTNLELEAANNIIIKIDGNTLGIVTSTGTSVPVVNTSINNTVIGSITPATAAFTSATVNSLPTIDQSVANKQYVDSTSLSLAIAFGL
tara:strand:- start:164 stop:1033 length:870 start_codon:yes stop_codon:yes gene_type:complete